MVCNMVEAKDESKGKPQKWQTKALATTVIIVVDKGESILESSG